MPRTAAADPNPARDAAAMLRRAARLAGMLSLAVLTPDERAKTTAECVANIDAARARLAE